MIKKAVIPAAGLGTRMLPLTKTQPKEMLPLGRKPCIQYIVEELGKRLIEQDVKLKYIPFRPAKPFIKCIRYFSSKFLVR